MGVDTPSASPPWLPCSASARPDIIIDPAMLVSAPTAAACDAINTPSIAIPPPGMAIAAPMAAAPIAISITAFAKGIVLNVIGRSGQGEWKTEDAVFVGRQDLGPVHRNDAKR